MNSFIFWEFSFFSIRRQKTEENIKEIKSTDLCFLLFLTGTFWKKKLGHINEIKAHRQNYSILQPLVPVFSGARFSHQEMHMAMAMSAAQGKIRFVRSSGKIKFPRLRFPCDSVTLLYVALKSKINIIVQSSQAISEFKVTDSPFIFFLAIVLCAE